MSLSQKLEDIHAQARKQATRIRLRGLRDALQVADKVTDVAKLRDLLDAAGLRLPELEDLLDPGDAPERARSAGAGDSGNGTASGNGMFDGRVEVEVGPLRDFKQLSDFEDAANEIGAAGEIKVKRFSGGRATLSMDLDGPVELLRELEQRAAMDFRVRSLKDDRVVLDIDADDEQQAA